MVEGVNAGEDFGENHEFEFQLVLQFEAESSSDFDDLISLYDALTQAVESGNPPAVLDGHDCGLGEFNCFIWTDNPDDSMLRVQQALALAPPKQPIRGIAYRKFEEDDYIVLWPTDLKQFCVA